MDVQEDVEILLAFYSEYDSALATEDKVNAIIGVRSHARHSSQRRLYKSIPCILGLCSRLLLRRSHVGSTNQKQQISHADQLTTK